MDCRIEKNINIGLVVLFNCKQMWGNYGMAGDGRGGDVWTCTTDCTYQH